MTPGSEGLAVASPPTARGLSRLTETNIRTPQGLSVSAILAISGSMAVVMTRVLALTLLIEVPLTPMEASSRP